MPEEKPQNAIRPIKLIYDLNGNADGSVLYCSGKTKVLCQASVLDHTPKFIKRDHGWITAEYAMMPAATNTRTDRESTRGRVNGRTAEIQRLIGRSIRACFDLTLLTNKTIHIDCDVIQADGGTRTAAINGGLIAAIIACQKLQYTKVIAADPLKRIIGAVSIGIKNNKIISDIDYKIDASCDADINIIMDENGDIIELQGTSEKRAYSPKMLSLVVSQGWENIQQIIESTKNAIISFEHQLDV